MADHLDEVEVANKRAPVIEPGHTFATVTDKISSIVLTRPTSLAWVVGFGVGFLMTMMLLFAYGGGDAIGRNGETIIYEPLVRE